MRDRPAHDLRRGDSGWFGVAITGLGDAMLLVLVALLFPLMILLVGAPVAFVLRVLIEMARRL